MEKKLVIFIVINLFCTISFSTQVNYDTESPRNEINIENQCDGFNYKFYQQYSEYVSGFKYYSTYMEYYF